MSTELQQHMHSVLLHVRVQVGVRFWLHMYMYLTWTSSEKPSMDKD